MKSANCGIEALDKVIACVKQEAPRSVLIVVDDYTGGVRDHIRSEIENLRRLGTQFHLLTDRPLVIGHDDVFKSINILDRPFQRYSWLDSLRCFQQIQSVVRICEIDLIHSHAYSLIPLAALCSKASSIPILNSFHGPDIFSILDDRTNGRAFRRQLISIGTQIAVSFELQRKLERRFIGLNVRAIYNPVRVPSGVSDTVGNTKSWLWAGRLSKDKLPGLFGLILMLKSCGQVGLDVYGMGEGEDELKVFVSAHWPGCVRIMGWKDDIEKVFHSYDVIAGMGRVAIDGMLARRPVFLVGYDNPKGFVTMDNFDSFMFANFSGRKSPFLTDQGFQESLAELRSNPSFFNLGARVAEHVDEENVWSKVLRIMPEAKPATGSAILGLLQWSYIGILTTRLKNVSQRLKLRFWQGKMESKGVK